MESKFEATKKATSWLNDQLADLRSKVSESERAVEIYRNEHGLTQGQSDKGLLIGEQLSEINSQLISAKAQRAEAAARLAQVSRLLNNNEGIETASEVLSSTLIQGLRNQEIELTRKISEMSVELGEKHPKLIQAHAQLDDLKGKIKTEIGKIAAGLRNELNIATARESSLESSLRSSEAKVGSTRKGEVQLRALEREANANKALFETFLNRFKETSTTQSISTEADARVISEAEIPDEPSFPDRKKMLIVIVAVANAIPIGIIFLLEMLHPGLRTPEEIERVLNLPTIALIPRMRKKLNAFDYILAKPHSALGEAISSLRMSLSLSDPDKEVKTIVITSSLPNEGKSTLALCLGRSAASGGQKVVIIDADFRRPTIEQKLGIDSKSKGLTDLIMSQDSNINLEEFMYLDEPSKYKDKVSQLFFMPKGMAEYVNPVDIFSSQKMNSVMLMLKKNFDLIIFDTPPIMPVTDAKVLGKLVDKTIYVVNWDKTPRHVIKSGLKQLRDSHVSLAGIALQQVDLEQYNVYYSGSGYYYHYQKYGQYYSN